MPRRTLIGMAVMPKPCETCPFGGAHRSPLTAESQAYYTEQLVTFQSQHLCHTADNQKICRGGRDIQLKLLCAMEAIDEPTDAAFEKAQRRYNDA